MAKTGKYRVIELLEILIIKDDYAFDTTGAELNKEVEKLRLAINKDYVELFWIGHQG